MRKTGKMMAAFLTAPLTLALAYMAVRAPISVYAAAQEPLGVSSEAASPESGGGASVATAATPTDGAFVPGEPFAALAAAPVIDESRINYWPDETGGAGLVIPVEGADNVYYLLLESTDAAPADATALVSNASKGTAPVNINFGNASIELDSLAVGVSYTVYLVADGAGGLSDLVMYAFTYLPPPPQADIDVSSYTVLSTTAAKISYIVYTVDPETTTVYWLLTQEEIGQDAGLLKSHEKTVKLTNVSGNLTLELSELIVEEQYSLYMMAEDSYGQNVGYISRYDFFMELPNPIIESSSVFGVTATSATVAARINFAPFSGGTVYWLLRKSLDAEPDDGFALMAEAREAGTVFEADSGYISWPVSGLSPNETYIVYLTAETDAGLSSPYLDTGGFTTLSAINTVPPVITAQPSHPDPIIDGEEAEFSVQVSGDNLYYEWQASDPGYGEPGWVGGISWVSLLDNPDVTGADTGTLRLSGEIAGRYYNTAFRCVVTNGAGTVISEPAVLTGADNWSVLEFVCGKSVNNHPIGRGLSLNYPLTAEVTATLPNTIDAIGVADLKVAFEGESLDNTSLSMYSDGNYRTKIPSTKLLAGKNNLYFSIDGVVVEGAIYYHVVVTREADNDTGGSSEPSGGSSEPGGGNGSDSLPDAAPGSSGDSGIDRGNDSAPDRNPPPIRPTAPTPPSPPREEAVVTNANGNPLTGGGDIPDAPETGDKSNAALWMIMLISPVLASSGLIAVYMRRGGKG